MRYAIADMSGRSHAYFDQRVDAQNALREIVQDDPDALDEFFLAGYDEAGVRVFGPQPASAVLGLFGLAVSLIVREIRQSLRRYLTGAISLEAFRDGLVDMTWGLDSVSDYATALDLRSQIEQLVTECPDESQLKAHLEDLAPSWWALEVQGLAPREALEFAGSN
jgi:hypothetical protein